MLVFKLPKILFALCFIALAICAYPLFAQTNITSLTSEAKTKMPKTITIFFHKFSPLLAWTQITPPNGVPIEPNRDIGFASVFLILENHQETNQTVTIQNIEIRNISDNQLQHFRSEAKQIDLKPLENSVIDIHLTNKTGYVGQDRVKAIVTYQIGKEVNIIESEPVEVDRH